MGNSRNKPDTQARIILQLIDNQVSGVAMISVDGSRTPPFHIRQLQQRGIPVVFCHRSVEGAHAPLLAIPFYDIGRMAGEAMIEQGHRRVALLQLSNTEQNPMTPLAHGFRDAIRAGGGDTPDAFIRKIPYRSPDIGIDIIEDCSTDFAGALGNRLYWGASDTPGVGTGFWSEVAFEISYPAPLPGDANADGVVDDEDAAILAANWQTQSGADWGDGDFNGDGAVDDIDATILATNWQTTAASSASVPEPGTITLLLSMIGSILLVYYRQRR